MSFPPNSILDDQHAVAVNEDRSTGTPVTTTHSHDDNKTTNDATPPNQVCNDENNCVKDASPAVEIITGPGFIGGMKEYKTLTIKKELPLEFGGSLPEVTISYSDLGKVVHTLNPKAYAAHLYR